MTATLPPAIKFQPLVGGAPLPGGKVYFYQAGTTTPQAVYAPDGITSIGNSLILDANGATSFRLGAGLAYKIDLFDANNVHQAGWPEDNVQDIASLAVMASDLASTASGKGAALIGYLAPYTGAVARTQADKNAETISPLDFKNADGHQAWGDGIHDDSVALSAAFATGKMVDGLGKSYKVVADTIIDTFATGVIGYGANKKWFLIGACKNITFIGDVSTGTNPGSYFLDKYTFAPNVRVQGDCRISSWYSKFYGWTVTGKTYLGGDFPATTNWVGHGYNTYEQCTFNMIIVDHRYGWVNLNTFIECQFKSFRVMNSGTLGWNGSFLPTLDFHMNNFIGCEWLTGVGQGTVATDGFEYCFVIDDNCPTGGINHVIGAYMEGAVRGFYGKGIEVENIHLSGVTVTNGGGEIGYNIPLSGEGGAAARGIPFVYPAANMLVGGDWSVLNSSGYPYCLSQTNHTVTLGTDAQEPTGLSKYVQFAATGAFSYVTLNLGAADAANRTLRSFAMVYKLTAGTIGWETQDAAGATISGAVSTTLLANGWVLAVGTTYGFARFTSASVYTIKISALSAARGGGVLSPGTNQPDGKAMLDFSGSADIMGDYCRQGVSTPYYKTNTKTMGAASGNVDWFTVDLGAFSGRVATVKVVFSISSGGFGARMMLRESLVMANGGGTLDENNLHNIAGVNGTLTFSLSGSVLTVRTTAGGTAETARMAIEVMGYDIGGRVTAL